MRNATVAIESTVTETRKIRTLMASMADTPSGRSSASSSLARRVRPRQPGVTTNLHVVSVTPLGARVRYLMAWRPFAPTRMIDHSRRTTSRPPAGANPRSMRSAYPNRLRSTCRPSIHRSQRVLCHARSIRRGRSKSPCPTKTRLSGGSWPHVRVRRPGWSTTGSQIVSNSHASASLLPPWTTRIPFTRCPGSIATSRATTADAPAATTSAGMHSAGPTYRSAMPHDTRIERY
jgi:hypothetical protein